MVWDRQAMSLTRADKGKGLKTGSGSKQDKQTQMG